MVIQRANEAAAPMPMRTLALLCLLTSAASTAPPTTTPSPGTVSPTTPTKHHQWWLYSDVRSRGPASWHTVAQADGALCNGAAQSPVNLGNANLTEDRSLLELDFRYQATRAWSIVNTQLSLTLTFAGDSVESHAAAAAAAAPATAAAHSREGDALSGGGGHATAADATAAAAAAHTTPHLLNVYALQSTEYHDELPTPVSEREKKEYRLNEVRVHAPSEHTIGGAAYDMEIELVHIETSETDHSGPNTKHVIVSLLFEAGGGGNAALAPILDFLPATPDAAFGFYAHPETGFDATAHHQLQSLVDLSALLPASKDYYAYDGSFSHPPCTEGVRRFVMRAPGLVSQAQLSAVRGALATAQDLAHLTASEGFVAGRHHVHGNARPTQALGDRRVSLYTDTGVGPRDPRTEAPFHMGATATLLATCVFLAGLIDLLVVMLCSNKGGPSV